MPTPTYVALAKTVLTGSQATITFSSIPGTYTDLVLLASARTDAAQNRDQIYLEFNGSATSYSWRVLRGTSTLATSASGTDGISAPRSADAATATSNTFGSIEFYIPNYAGSTNKPVSITGAQENNTTTANDANIEAVAALWSNTAAITSIAVKRLDGTNFVSGSRFDLYGIKNS